jgi:hypothetical protein
MKSGPNDAMLRDLRQFADSHLANGEPRTADLLFRAADHIERMVVAHEEDRRKDRQRIDRLVALQSERTGA